VGRSIESSGDFVALLCESDVLFPNYFGRTCFLFCIWLIFRNVRGIFITEACVLSSALISR